jgi:hypothetical protein
VPKLQISGTFLLITFFGKKFVLHWFLNQHKILLYLIPVVNFLKFVLILLFRNFYIYNHLVLKIAQKRTQGKPAFTNKSQILILQPSRGWQN